jgi:hypothetical protein
MMLVGAAVAASIVTYLIVKAAQPDLIVQTVPSERSTNPNQTSPSSELINYGDAPGLKPTRIGDLFQQ